MVALLLQRVVRVAVRVELQRELLERLFDLLLAGTRMQAELLVGVENWAVS